MEAITGIPITKAFKAIELIPLDRINPPQDLVEFLDKILVTGYDDEVYANRSGGRFEVTLSSAEEAVLEIPGIEGFALVFGGQEGNLVTLGVDMKDRDYTFKFGGGLRIRISRSVLKPVIRSNEEWIDDPTSPYAYIPLTVAMLIDSDWNVSFEGTNEFSVGPAMIGDSGFVIEGTLSIDFSENSSLPETIALGLGDSWQGAVFKSLTLYLPQSLDVPILPSDLTLTNFHIGSGGISGTITGNWTPTINGLNITGNGAGELFGIPFGLKSISVGLIQNSFTEFELKGAIAIPFFEQAVEVTLAIDHEGNINVALDSPTGLAELTIPNVVKMELSSIEFEIEEDIFAIKLAGELTPLIPGIDWPSFEIKELSIDSEGNVKIEGGWINLPDQYSIDFYGFQLEITQLGFGNNEDNSKWLGFSGGLKLIDGFQAGASVEGLRITWGNGDPKISFNGIGVEFEVPNAVRFKGEVSFREFEQLNPVTGVNEKVQRFDGEIKLELIALNLQIDAKLVIGSAEEADGSTYNFFAIFLGAELPAGIPLFNTGLALYGLAGLFALQMEPNKTPDEVWYGIGEGEGWYKKPEIGVTDLKNKWVNVPDSFALGAGITIGTLPDNGFTFSGKFLLVLVIPGPIIMLEGKANMLKERSELDEDPIFRSIAVLDGREGSFLFGLDAQYKFGSGGELIEIGGGVEAFFSFSDPMSWHLYIGIKEPREKRIRAEIFQLFEANAYFMLDAYKLAMGAWVGYDKKWSFGPLKVTLEAWLEHNVILSWNPVFLYGDIWAHGKAELSVFGFGIGLSIDAKLAGQIFDPFWIKGEFEVGINLPWPLPDFSVDISIQWGPKKVAPTIPSPLKEAAIEHLKVSTAWSAPLLEAGVNANGIPNNLPADFDIPVVPLDARPNVTFNKSVHDVNMIGVNVNNPIPIFEVVGDAEKNEGAVEVKYKIENTILQKFDGVAYIDVAGKDLAGVDDIFGSWAPEPKQPANAEPGDLSINQSKLLIWSKTPYNYNRQINKTWDEWFDGAFENYPCPRLPEGKEFCYDFEDIPLDSFYTMIFRHPENEGLILFWLSPTFHTVDKLDNPLGEKEKAFCFTRRNNSEFIKLDNNLVYLVFPEAVSKVRLCLRSSDEVSIQAIAILPNSPDQLTPIGGSVPAGAGQPEEIIIEYPVNIINGLVFTGSFCLSCVCFTIGASIPEAVNYQETLTHLNSEMARWGEEGAILEPFSLYRLKIISGYESQAKDVEYSGDPAFEKTENFENYIYFRTEGPPGLVELSPANNPAAQGSGEGSNEALQNLNLYVKQTVPATIPKKGEKPSLPKPVYRAYDVGVEFNEDYVELMYKISQRDLGIYLYDNNNQPVRDANGKLIVLSNQWGKAEELTLLESETRYIEQLKKGDCVNFDENIIPKDSTLRSLSDKRVLKADIVYDARLIPLLYQDSFLEDKGAWLIDTEGNINGPANWSWVNHPDIENTGFVQALNVLTLNGNPDLSSIDASFDSIVLEGDLARPTGTYRILSVNDATNQVTLDANPQVDNPAITKWTIPAIGAVVQTSNVHGGSLIATSPDKKGTILYLKDRPELKPEDQASKWTNYRFTAVLRPNDNDGIGVVFRYGTPSGVKSYYRFAFNNERKYRRLVKVINNNHTILGEDSFVYDTHSDYQITVEAIDDQLKIYQDGVLIFDVVDASISQGTIGLYCWAQRNGRFNEVRIDDFRENASVVYQFKFTTGLYANFFHHLHSFLDETWKLDLPNAIDLAAASNAALAPSTTAGETEFRAYDKIAQELFGASANIEPLEVQISRILQDDNTLAWLLQSPEPLLWDRLTIDFKQSQLVSELGKAPTWLKLTDLNFSTTDADNEYVEVLMKNSRDLNGVSVQYAGFEGVPLSKDLDVLFEDDFKYIAGLLYKEKFGTHTLNKYQIIDNGTSFGPSNWAVVGNTIRQSANIYGGDTVNPLLAPGTLALIGNKNWNNVHVKVVLRSGDNDAIGFVFRYQNEDNFCRFSMDKQRSYRRIIQVKDGITQILWEDNIAYVQNQNYVLEIMLHESTAILYLNHILLYAGDGIKIESGKLGYYSWLNTAADFEGLTVTAILQKPLQYKSDFANQNFTIIDHENVVQGPSNWIVKDNSLVQLSNIHSQGNWSQKFGTFALIEETQLEDTTISMVLSSQDNDVLGMMFRVKPIGGGAYNYYRFSMDKQTSKRRLEKKVGTTLSLLWQDNFTYQTGVDYALTVKSIQNKHKIYFNGQLLTELVDASINQGGLALFSWANRGSIFKDIVISNSNPKIGSWQIVDEGSISSPSEWFTNGEYFGQRTNIHTNSLPEAPGTLALAGSTDWDNYSFKTRLKSKDDDAIGVLFRYQDNRNYYRFSMDSQRNYRRLSRMKNGVLTILREETEGFETDQSYEIKIDVIGNLIKVFLDGTELFRKTDNSFSTGKIGLYSWANTGAVFSYVKVTSPLSEVYTLFKDQFSKEGLIGWQVRDLGTISTPSSWLVENGILRQTSNIRNGVSISQINKRGTFVLAGNAAWTDIVFSATVRSLSDDEFGIVFRYINDQNHYRFTMNNQGSYRRLTRVKNGLYQLLWEDNYQFELDKQYRLTAIIENDHIRVFTDGLQTLSLQDDTHASGKIGLHCWASENTYFSNIQVYDSQVLREELLLEENFDGNSTLSWSFIDEADGVSDWQIQGQSLVQSSNIWGGSTNSAVIDKPGTYAIAEQKIYTDFRLQVEMENADNDVIGVVFQYQDQNNYYRFSMDAQRTYRRLVKKVSGNYELIWEDDANGYDPLYRQTITVDALEGKITIYLNGISLCEVTDDTFDDGKIGMYCWASQGATFYSVKVMQAKWKTFYQFGKEDKFADGSRFRIYSGNKANAFEAVTNIEQRFVADLDQVGVINFTGNLQKLRLLTPKEECLHQNVFQRSSKFSNENIKVLRKRDGTAFFIFKADNGAFVEGNRQIAIAFKRNNKANDSESQIWKQAGDDSNEIVVLNVPWVINDMSVV